MVFFWAGVRRYGTGPVAQAVGDLADPGGGVGVQALGAVEGERDRGLGDARLPRHVGDAGAPGPAATPSSSGSRARGQPT